jgi:O-antigen ligase
MQKVITWWEHGLVAALGLSIALLGFGRVDLLGERGGVSAWSISRTTFFLWLILKFLLLVRGGWAATRLSEVGLPPALILFFIGVTLSLLPDFHQAGDYRYFFFGAMHALMILDLFADPKRLRPIYLLLALLPAILVVRGIVHDPSVLQLEHMQRLRYPLPHPNIAGYLFAMTLPLCLALAMTEAGRLHKLALVSSGAQLAGLILTYSRGAWIGWLASMVFFGAALKRKEVVILLVVAGLVLCFAPPLRNRVLTLVKPQADLSINERVQSMEGGLRVGLQHPILGVGYGRGRLREGLGTLNTRAITRIDGTTQPITRIAHTHNLYVELFASTGGLGLGAFLWLLGRGLWQVLANARRVEGPSRVLQWGMAAAWIAFMVTALWDAPLYHHDIRILFFTLLALIYLHARDHSFLRGSAEGRHISS